ncbi:hypothetical protein KC921_05040 [Candidatus Woesebacteria bacterium]|nr:hypothetical protein [Candidatus Woesebacteria bacterium]
MTNYETANRLSDIPQRLSIYAEVELTDNKELADIVSALSMAIRDLDQFSRSEIVQVEAVAQWQNKIDNLTHLIAQLPAGETREKVIRMIDQEHLMVMSDSEWQWVQENLSRTQRIESEAAQMTSVADLDRVIQLLDTVDPTERWPWLTGGPNERTLATTDIIRSLEIIHYQLKKAEFMHTALATKNPTGTTRMALVSLVRYQVRLNEANMIKTLNKITPFLAELPTGFRNGCQSLVSALHPDQE